MLGFKTVARSELCLPGGHDSDRATQKYPATCLTLWVLAMTAGCSLPWRAESATVIQVELPQDVDPLRREESQTLADRGLEQHQLGKSSRSAELLENAVAADPSNGVAHNNLGLVHFDAGRLADAAEHFEAATGLLPEDPVPLSNLAMALESGGRVDEAVPMYRRAVELSGGRPLYLGNLIRAKYRLGDRDELIREQMRQLLFAETRPAWRRWLQERLELEMNPHLDRGAEMAAPPVASAEPVRALAIPMHRSP